MESKDIKHLEFIYERMKNVHGENVDYDYMVRFREILKSLYKENYKTNVFSESGEPLFFDKDGNMLKSSR